MTDLSISGKNRVKWLQQPATDGNGVTILTTVIIITQSDTTCFLIKVIFQALKFLRTDNFRKENLFDF